MKIAWIVAMMITALGSAAEASPTPEDLYDEGQAAYNGTDYVTAIVKWRASYEISREPVLLFNIAHAYRLSGDCKQAMSTYRQFISIDPKADERSLADDLVRELEPRCGASIPAPTPAIPKPAPTIDQPVAKPGRTLKIAGLVAGGAGMASIAIGIGLGHHASTLGDEATLACSVSCDWSAEKSRDASGHRYATLGYAFDVLGVAAIASGAILYYLGDRESEIHIAPLVARHESGAVVSWSGSW